jgi:hypothetical protein
MVQLILNQIPIVPLHLLLVGVLILLHPPSPLIQVPILLSYHILQLLTYLHRTTTELYQFVLLYAPLVVYVHNHLTTSLLQTLYLTQDANLLLIHQSVHPTDVSDNLFSQDVGVSVDLLLEHGILVLRVLDLGEGATEHTKARHLGSGLHLIRELDLIKYLRDEGRFS